MTSHTFRTAASADAPLIAALVESAYRGDASRAGWTTEADFLHGRRTDVTEMIALFLKHAGYTVTTANSAKSALDLAVRQTFDLIISDIGMPEMNGYELAESLRTLNDYQATPLIAVTGYTEYDDRGRSLRAGFDAHLTKPINPSHLLDLVSKFIG